MLNRRAFLTSALVTAAAGMTTRNGTAQSQDRPNILWLTCEDISPNLGCFGDTFARTPNLDALAARGVRFTNTYASAPVCAVARSSIITGVWPAALGSHHMRCETRLPDRIKCFTEYLRNAGYYCTNNVKTDYNFPVPPNAWDECTNKAHWRTRGEGQPFFSVFNFVGTHESQCRKKPREPELFPPSKVPLPAFHPDAPAVRENWAEYYENISEMDAWAADLLEQLKADGLADKTIVFFYSDHGAGMPGIKKQCWGPGLQVPMIIHFPERYAAWAPAARGAATDRMVSFLDLPPTVLSLAGLDIPDYMDGSAFLGPKARPPRQYIQAARDRMGERYDMVRAVRDKRFQYNRNYLPWFSWSQFMSYTEEMPTMQVWRQYHDAGKLDRAQDRYFDERKPLEELYDVQADPWQINNLAGDPKYAAEMARMRGELRRWLRHTRDLGFLNEHEIALRSKALTPYELAQDRRLNPCERLWEAADTACAMDPKKLPSLVRMLKDEDSAIRWWGASGLEGLGADAAPAREAILKALKDPNAAVRIAAAEAASNLGEVAAALDALRGALQDEERFAKLMALNVLDRMGEKARPAVDAIRQCKAGEYGARMTEYIPQRNFGS